MGMTIDEAIHDTEVMKEYLEYRGEIRSEGLGVAIDTMRKYQKLQADYENRLKADITDILGKIKIELHVTAEMHDDGDYYLRDEWIDEIFDKYKLDSEYI